MSGGRKDSARRTAAKEHTAAGRCQKAADRQQEKAVGKIRHLTMRCRSRGRNTERGHNDKAGSIPDHMSGNICRHDQADRERRRGRGSQEETDNGIDDRGIMHPAVHADGG